MNVKKNHVKYTSNYEQLLNILEGIVTDVPF